MNKVAKFSKVSFEQFKKDMIDTFPSKFNDEMMDEKDIDNMISQIYDGIKLPERSTVGSAGYDFRSPIAITIPVNGTVKIPTGIRCEMENGWVLMEFPRSGLGFKYGLSMANTVGIIDADYFNANNEGHIFIKLTNDSVLAKEIKIGYEDAFCQGIFLPFGITVDDNATGVRTGGFGSTGK